MDVLGRGCNGREVEPIRLCGRGNRSRVRAVQPIAQQRDLSGPGLEDVPHVDDAGGLFGLAFRVLGAFGSGLLAGFAL
jgi:hypothetical protein